MAKIYISAILNRTQGRLGDVVYQTLRGTGYTRLVSTSTFDPKTARNLQIRKNFGDLSTSFSTLTAGEKDLWREWANIKGRKGGAFCSYKSVNLNLLNASHTDLVAISSPPKAPGTPEFPKHFSVAVLGPSQVCLQWTTPADLQTYVTGHFRINSWFCHDHPCYGDCLTVGYRKSPRFIKTVRADAQAIQHVHAWPAGTKLYYWLNSIDKSGRKSPITHTIQVTTPV